MRHKRGKAGIFALGEGGLYAAARVVQNLAASAMLVRETLCRTRKVELNNLRGAGTHQKEHADIGPTGKQLAHHPIKFFVGIGQACKVALIDNGRGKTRFGKDHHAGG